MKLRAPYPGLVTGTMLAMLAALPAPALAQASRAELEQRVVQLERQAESQGLVELARQLDALQAELRALRGDLEQLQFVVDGAREQQRAQYLDLDKRLQAAEAGAARVAEQAQASASDPAAEYQAAFDRLKAADYTGARRGFETFLAAHPAHELAANAQYWLGEVSYVERDYEVAMGAFGKVLSRYPQARKAPDALLKTGFCQYELTRYPQARATLSKVIADYPDTPAAADAATRLARMTAEGH